jgi:hypothetical protein
VPRVCKKEHREYSRQYHQKHKEERNRKAREKRRQNKLKAVDYKGGRCEDCKQSFHPAVYDFHHINPEEKDVALGTLMNWNWGRQQEELDKCVLLCANCHRLRHHKEATYE